MREFVQHYHFNSFYVCLLLLIYNIWKSNHEFINLLLEKLLLLNSTSFLIMINIIGIYLFLRNVSFEINIKWSIKYK